MAVNIQVTVDEATSDATVVFTWAAAGVVISGVVGAAPPDTIRCATGGVVEAATWAATWAPTRTAIDAEIR